MNTRLTASVWIIVLAAVLLAVACANYAAQSDIEATKVEATVQDATQSGQATLSNMLMPTHSIVSVPEAATENDNTVDRGGGILNWGTLVLAALGRWPPSVAAEAQDDRSAELEPAGHPPSSFLVNLVRGRPPPPHVPTLPIPQTQRPNLWAEYQDFGCV